MAPPPHIIATQALAHLLGLGRREEAAGAILPLSPTLLRGEGTMVAGEVVDELQRCGRTDEAAELGASSLCFNAPFIWGPHAPSRAVFRALAEHPEAVERITVS